MIKFVRDCEGVKFGKAKKDEERELGETLEAALIKGGNAVKVKTEEPKKEKENNFKRKVDKNG